MGAIVILQVTVDKAVAELLALKEEYKKLTGKEFPAPSRRAPSAKKEKPPQAPKKEKSTEKTHEVSTYFGTLKHDFLNSYLIYIFILCFLSV